MHALSKEQLISGIEVNACILRIFGIADGSFYIDKPPLHLKIYLFERIGNIDPQSFQVNYFFEGQGVDLYQRIVVPVSRRLPPSMSGILRWRQCGNL